ncbi:MAG: hypothetical protein JKY65_33845 [Planctomycetes bacterium]|nr:hypothetical protein [Planctomycetota bacterium]
MTLLRQIRSVSLRLALVVVACGVGACGTTVATPLDRQAELDSDLAGSDFGRSALDDYWSESLGPYLGTKALRGYWLTPAEDRFGDYGDRLLEACLREELFGQHTEDLSPEEFERLARLPDYDAAERELDAILSERRGR